MMSVIEEIRQLIKNKVVIRHRNHEELLGGKATCLICNREIILPPGSLCMVVDNEGPICPVCGAQYAPEMTKIMEGQLSSSSDPQQPQPYTNEEGQYTQSKSQLVEIYEDMDKLLEVTDTLAKGLARGIVEAPAGHIGLLHYAKEIHKPERRFDESEKDYELRVRTFRISRLYEKIYEDTAGRIKRIMDELKKIGLPLA
jgi:hypothetical protein